jgi:hypothetical protein
MNSYNQQIHLINQMNSCNQQIHLINEFIETSTKLTLGTMLAQLLLSEDTAALLTL